MGVVVATTFGFCLFIILWALGANSQDAFMLLLLIVLLAATGRMLSPYLPGNRE